MRILHRQLVTGTLLALYGTIALLGHGLHWLSLADHHHHGQIAASGEHRHSHHDHHHAHHHHVQPAALAADGISNRPLGVAASDGAVHAHECDICAFLLQARGERPQVVAAVVWQHVVSAALAALQRSYSPVSLGPHAARGPPSSSLQIV